ncbi:hypothetical protein ACYOEI_29785, partial [Singulisphaera rosea]
MRWLPHLLWVVTAIGQPGLAQDAPGAGAPRRVLERNLSFERWAYSPYANREAMQAELDARLEARLRELDEVYDLSPLQEKKLRLAARGDFRRIFEVVDQMQGRFESLPANANQAIAFHREMRPVRNDLFADPLGDASFLEKVLTKTLVGAQVARHRERLRERALSEYRGWIDVLITHENQGLGLSNEQRRGLAELLRDVA